MTLAIQVHSTHRLALCLVSRAQTEQAQTRNKRRFDQARHFSSAPIWSDAVTPPCGRYMPCLYHKHTLEMAHVCQGQRPSTAPCNAKVEANTAGLVLLLCAGALFHECIAPRRYGNADIHAAASPCAYRSRMRANAASLSCHSGRVNRSPSAAARDLLHKHNQRLWAR